MNRTRFWLTILVVFVACAAWAADRSPPETWATAYENSPANSDTVAQSDDWQRGRATDIRQRVAVEMNFSTFDSGEDNGLHRIGSARCFMQDSAPTELNEAGAGGPTDNQGPGAFTIGGASVKTLSANAPPAGGGNELIGSARCWWDIDGADGIDGTDDDFTLWAYGQSGWVLAHTELTASQNAPNELYNASFEADENAATTLPSGWTEIGSPTYIHSVTEETEGEGTEVQLTSTGTFDGMSQVLNEMKRNTEYAFVARAFATTASDVCSINVAGEQTSPASAFTADATTTTATGYEQLFGTFTTTDASPPASVTIQLFVDGNGDVCKFDHIGVFERLQGPAHAGRWITENTNTDTTNITGDQVLVTSLTSIAPHSSCIATVTGLANIEITSLDQSSSAIEFDLLLRVNKDVSGAQTIALYRYSADEFGANTKDLPGPGQLTGYVTKATASATMEAGSTYVFDLYYDEIAKTDVDTDLTGEINRLSVDWDCR